VEYTTKKFDATKKNNCRRLKYFKRAIRQVLHLMVATIAKSLSLKIQALRAQLQPAAYGQSQIVVTSHLIILP
jgi:hypothetical protein